MAELNTLEQWYYDVPIVTRVWTTAAVLTSVLVQCQIVTPFQLFYSPASVWQKRQYWRLGTTFLYFGPLSLDFMFHIFFMSRYSRNLEESSFRGRTADFAWLIVYAAVSLLILSPIASMPFLGSPLSFSLVYIWARRNPAVRLSFLGLFVFSAPYLPWVLLGFSLLLNNTLPKDDLLGIVVGHVYYFFSDIYPRIRNGSRPLDPPAIWRRMFAAAPPPPPPEVPAARAE
ncbi:Der1-like protein [Choiromyces venosus 120613-1]|uniref:Derlin n=1 Tax=Choiromyces venosus 120613-1 TaxID=1336337 RepID=A0A3N4JPA9_9PEZI|nr:Der1-like protein [Choiromyces venosus 120613-1]